MMVWPFSRRSTEASHEAAKKVEPSPEDRAVYDALKVWVKTDAPSLRVEVGDDGALYMRPGPSSDPVVMARSRGGKLVRLEVYDPALRPLVDRLVKAFEKEGLWSFNGVVRTLPRSG